MSKGTIIYIGGFELPDKNAAAQRVMANAKIFTKLGYSTVFIGIDRKIKFSDGSKITKQEFDGFTCWGTPYPNGNKEWLKYLTNIHLFLEIASEYNDIKAVICYNYQAIAFGKIRGYCKRKGIKIISDCSEWYGTNEGNIVFRLLKYLDTTLRMKVINRQVDSLIVVSDYLRNYYKEENTVLIPTLINMEKMGEPIYSNNEIFKLIYAGVPFRLGRPLKNSSLAKDRLDIAIKLLYLAYNRGVQFKFDIYGLTKEQYLEVLPNDYFMLDTLKNNIFFHGRRSNKEIQNLMRHADFSLLIRDENRTTKAGFPTKFTESINCGVPLISTKTSDLDKYLIEGKNGFFIDINKKNLDVEKFIEILSLSNNQLNEMKQYCFNTNIFNIENWVKEAKLIFEK
jgi:glycosyltransferase involved in cell wall biosynthesis